VGCGVKKVKKEGESHPLSIVLSMPEHSFFTMEWGWSYLVQNALEQAATEGESPVICKDF